MWAIRHEISLIYEFYSAIRCDLYFIDKTFKLWDGLERHPRGWIVFTMIMQDKSPHYILCCIENDINAIDKLHTYVVRIIERGLWQSKGLEALMLYFLSLKTIDPRMCVHNNPSETSIPNYTWSNFKTLWGKTKQCLVITLCNGVTTT